MADLRNLSKIYNTLAEACRKTFEPSENQAQVHAQYQTYVQAKRDLTRACNGATSQAKEINDMITAADAEAATSWDHQYCHLFVSSHLYSSNNE